MEKIAVVVEDVDISRTALRWALHSLLRNGDVVTLLHVYSAAADSRSEGNRHLLRLNGIQLALSFTDICSPFRNIRVDIVVTDGDNEGQRIAALVTEIGASTLVLGLHNRSFLHKLVVSEEIGRIFKCRVFAVKSDEARSVHEMDSFGFSQIQLSTLGVPVVPPTKIPYKLCPDPTAIIWRSSRTSRTTKKLQT